MRKALATFGSRHAADLLALSLPTFMQYAQRHGYELVVGTADSHGRPAAWGKIPFLRRLLESYEFVLWIDADAIILDTTTDIETVIPADAFQALVVTTLEPGRGSCPCTGVWALRAGPRAQKFLATAWEQVDLIEHDYWEQTAVMRLIGWGEIVPTVKERATEWDDGTFMLNEEWDLIPQYAGRYAPSKIRHYTGWPSYHRRAFDMATDAAGLRGNHLRHWLGLLERRCRPAYLPVRGWLLHRARRS
jgi:hypothetical protein